MTAAASAKQTGEFELFGVIDHSVLELGWYAVHQFVSVPHT
jgi:hypothetical protein